MDSRKIKLAGKYWLTIDKYQIWIEEEYTNPKTGKPGMRRVTGYFHDYASLLEDFAHRKIRNAEGATVKELLENLKAEEDIILELARVLQNAK